MAGIPKPIVGAVRSYLDAERFLRALAEIIHKIIDRLERLEALTRRGQPQGRTQQVEVFTRTAVTREGTKLHKDRLIFTDGLFTGTTGELPAGTVQGGGGGGGTTVQQTTTQNVTNVTNTITGGVYYVGGAQD